MHRTITTHLLAATLLLVGAAKASAYCTGDPITWPSVPIRLHADLHNQMRHINGTPWTRAELERAVYLAIAHINASAGADVPHLWLDTATPPSTCAWFVSDALCSQDESMWPPVWDNCAIPQVIHIIPSNCSGPFWAYSGMGAVGHIIYMKSSYNFDPEADVFYEHFSTVPGQSSVIMQHLTHEIGHGILQSGNHPTSSNPPGDEQCFDPSWATTCPANSQPCAIMDGVLYHNRAFEYYLPDDRDGIRALYAYRPSPVERLFESSNLTNGVDELGFPHIQLEGFSAMSSDASATPTSTTIVGYLRNGVTPRPQVYTWNWSTLEVTNLGSLSSHTTNGPLGAAQSSVYHFAVSSSYRMSANSRRWRRRVKTSYRSTSGSGGWTTVQSNPAVDAIDDTNAPGISAAYDPQSAAVMYALRSTEGAILLQAGTSGTPQNTGVYSSSPPSIACAPITGDNCIAVLVEPGTPITAAEYRLEWFRFSWNPATGFHFGFMQTEPYVIWNGDPQVSVYRVGSSYEYVVTYLQSLNTTTYGWVLRMPVTSGAFSFWGQALATTTGVPTHVANGSTRDIEMLVLSN